MGNGFPCHVRDGMKKFLSQQPKNGSRVKGVVCTSRVGASLKRPRGAHLVNPGSKIRTTRHFGRGLYMFIWPLYLLLRRGFAGRQLSRLNGVEGFYRQTCRWSLAGRPRGRPGTSLRNRKSLRAWKVSKSGAMSSPPGLPGGRGRRLDDERPFKQLGGMDGLFGIHRPLLNQRTRFS